MPITKLACESDPLSQGDILEGVRLFSTQEPWVENGGSSRMLDAKLCLVISRPCVASHKTHVTVVPIEKVNSGIPDDVKSFSDVLEFLTSLRDGTNTPDMFYIGELPERKGRFAARLDSFHDVQFPSGKDRAEFVAKCRIGRLDIEFSRDLHSRIFRAFASLGFDDTGWITDEDLEWVLEKGRAEIADAQRDLHDKQAEQSKKSFSGKDMPQNVVSKSQERLDRVKEVLAPFEEELMRRS